MELRKKFDLRLCLTVIYILVAAIYLAVGLQQAGATHYEISTTLTIPKIGLASDVTSLILSGDGLETPDYIVGSYSRTENKTLLIGHSTSVFQNLNSVKIGDEIFYGENKYIVQDKVILAKNEINMHYVLKSESENTLAIMTCAGELLDGGDATHRLILTAVQAE